MNQSPDNQTTPEPSAHAGSATSIRVLCLLLLLYIPVQWIVGRSPGSTAIFSSQHQHIKREFLGVTAALRDQLIAQCAQHGVRDIYFTDGDVISPYLVREVQAQPGCFVHRETVVTPMEDAPKLACSALIVDEGMPNAWNVEHNWDYPDFLEGQAAPVGEWESDDRQFDFKLLQAKGCAHTGLAAGETR
jgi:hypothetical protein